jgi:SAM-dependent methyltransferase
MSSAPSPELGAYVHPDEARMAAWRRVYDRYLVIEDIYPGLSSRILELGAQSFVELGAGRGPMSRILAASGVRAIALDTDDRMLAESHRPAIKGDLGHLPLGDGCVDAASAVNCLYFLADPVIAVREAHRVLRPGGVFVASTPSRWNDPELEGIDPRWGRPSPFDSEDAGAVVSAVFADVEVEAWEVVAYRLPDRAAIADYLHGFNIPDWEEKAALITPPLEITKLGAQLWARRSMG